MIKERRLRWLGHAARRSDNNMVKQLLFATRKPGHVQPIGRPCGTWTHYAMRDVKDMGQQMGYRSLEWNWPKKAMNKSISASIVDGSTPRYRLVCICFPTPGRGLPYGSGMGLSRCLGPGECLHSFIHSSSSSSKGVQE